MTDWLGQHWVELAILVMLILTYFGLWSMGDSLEAIRRMIQDELNDRRK